MSWTPACGGRGTCLTFQPPPTKSDMVPYPKQPKVDLQMHHLEWLATSICRETQAGLLNG
jgi:hypothetical protein